MKNVGTLSKLRHIVRRDGLSLREFTNAYPQRMSLNAAGTLAYLCTSPCDLRLAQERFPKIHIHPLREHTGFALGSAD